MSTCTTCIQVHGADDRTTAHMHYSFSPILTPKYLNSHPEGSLRVTCLSTMIQTIQSVVLLLVFKWDVKVAHQNECPCTISIWKIRRFSFQRKTHKTVNQFRQTELLLDNKSQIKTERSLKKKKDQSCARHKHYPLKCLKTMCTINQKFKF
jgi:hypothetical protein